MKPDGGSAFPVVGNRLAFTQDGMSLRDYFAAKAIQAIIVGNRADECSLGIGAAKDAYAVADAMLAAREAE